MKNTHHQKTFRMKKTRNTIVAIIVLLANFISSPSFGQIKITAPPVMVYITADEFKTNMRKLCEEHVNWTRNVILCMVDSLPGKDQTIKRLMQNQVAIGNAMKAYYGEAKGNELSKLLKTHIEIMMEAINYAKLKNTPALHASTVKWYANADDISLFLNKANPYCALTELKLILHDHLTLTIDEVRFRLTQNYDADVITYDHVQSDMLEISDMLSDNIVKQYPTKFEAGCPPISFK